jgi:hypothetical protein
LSEQIDEMTKRNQLITNTKYFQKGF